MNLSKIIGGIAMVGFGIWVYHMYTKTRKQETPKIKKK